MPPVCRSPAACLPTCCRLSAGALPPFCRLFAGFCRGLLRFACFCFGLLAFACFCFGLLAFGGNAGAGQQERREGLPGAIGAAIRAVSAGSLQQPAAASPAALWITRQTCRASRPGASSAVRVCSRLFALVRFCWPSVGQSQTGRVSRPGAFSSQQRPALRRFMQPAPDGPGRFSQGRCMVLIFCLFHLRGIPSFFRLRVRFLTFVTSGCPSLYQFRASAASLCVWNG